MNSFFYHQKQAILKKETKYLIFTKENSVFRHFLSSISTTEFLEVTE